MSIRFSTKPMAFAVALIATGGLLSACGGGSSDGPRIQVSPANAYLLTSQNRIIGVDLDDTEFARQGSFVGNGGFGILTNTVDFGEDGYSANALDKNEKVLDIDYRNSEGLLYGLTRVDTEGRIVIIDPVNGTIFRRGKLVTSVTDPNAMPPTVELNAASYTIDFNPKADALRVIANDGTNLRVSIAKNSTQTAGSTPPATALTMVDGSINCDTPAIDNCLISTNSDVQPTITGAAYTDEGTPTGNNRTTRLFGMDLTKTYAIDANAGTITKVRMLGITAQTVNGFDINPANNQGVAVLTVGGTPSVYAVDSSATAAGNAATRLTNLPALSGGETYTGLSLVTAANPTVVTPP